MATSAHDATVANTTVKQPDTSQHEDRDDNEEHGIQHQQSIDNASLLAFYTSHALFMTNNRGYEFASVLFTASAFPHTLVAASLRGLSAHLSSVLLSPSIGRWCDASTSRLRPVQICIVVQRFCIAFACLGWALIVEETKTHPKEKLEENVHNSILKKTIFATLLVLGMLERLSAVGNLIVVERDWLPLLAAGPSTENAPTNPGVINKARTWEETPLLDRSTPPQLHNLNATAKLIDLITKLVTPLAVSAVTIGLSSVRSVAAVLAAVQLLSCVLELYLTRLVWTGCPALRTPKHRALVVVEDTGSPQQPTYIGFGQRIKSAFRPWLHSIQTYTRSSAFFPSVAFAIEPFSVLTLAGSMTSYLLVADFPLTHITAARTASTMVEISSTIITPLIIAWHSRTRRQSSGEGGSCIDSLVAVGLLGLSWQIIFLIPATVLLVIIGSSAMDLWTTTKLTSLLFSTLALSRLGPFAYSLVEQQIVQLKVPEAERMRFSGIEMALVDFSELARWGLLGVFGAPRQFRWVAVISFGSVVLSFVLFAAWTRKRRHMIAGE